MRLDVIFFWLENFHVDVNRSMTLCRHLMRWKDLSRLFVLSIQLLYLNFKSD